MSGDIYDIMVKDLMARRQAEEEASDDEEDDDSDEDEDEDEEDSSDSDSSSEDEEEKAILKKKLSEDNEDEGSGSLIRERERKQQMEEAIKGKEATREADEEVSIVVQVSPQKAYASTERKWVSTSNLPSPPSLQREAHNEASKNPPKNESSRNGPFLGWRKKDSKEKEKEKEESADGKKRTKGHTKEESSSTQEPGKGKVRDIIRGQWEHAFLSLREEKEELKGKLQEWRAQRHDEKKEKEIEKELKRNAKEEAKKKKKKEKDEWEKQRKADAEWDKKDRKAAEAYAKRYGLTFDDRPREGVKCYTSFSDDDGIDKPLQPIVGGRT